MDTLTSRVFTSCRTVLVGYTALALTTGAVGQGEQQRSGSGYYKQPGRSYIAIPAIPTPIQVIDLQSWAYWLVLSDEQLQILERLHVLYREREEKVHMQYVQPMWDRSAELAPAAADLNITITMAFSDMLESDRPEAVRRVISVENQLFDELIPFLSESQIEHLSIVRHLRQRHRFDMLEARYPGCEVDVAGLLYDICKSGLDVTPTDREALDSAVREYISEAAILSDRRCEAHLDVAIRGAIATAGIIGGAPSGREGLRAERRKLNRRLVDAERRLYELNVRTLALFTNLLPASTADALATMVRTTVFEPVYPDPTDLKVVFESALSACAGAGSRHAEIAAIQQVANARRLELCQTMEHRFLEWRETFGVEWAYPNNIRENYIRDMHLLHDQRISNATEAIRLMKEALHADEFSEVAPLIETFSRRLANHRFVSDRMLGE